MPRLGWFFLFVIGFVVCLFVVNEIVVHLDNQKCTATEKYSL